MRFDGLNDFCYNQIWQTRLAGSREGASVSKQDMPRGVETLLLIIAVALPVALAVALVYFFR